MAEPRVAPRFPLPVGRSGRDALAVARAIATDAAELLRRRFGDPGRAEWKGRGNVVTEVDLAVEALVHDALRAEFPEHAVLSEETAGETRSDGWLWVCDPIDGTKNFSRGIPHFCFTIGLWRGGEPVVGVTTHPVSGEEVWAVAGGGAFLGERAARVSAVTAIDRAVVALDLGYDPAGGAAQLELARRFWGKVETIRISGSAALGLAFVAAGKWDLFVHRDLQPWDLAAGILLVREAGGMVTDGEGAPAGLSSRTIIAAAPALHAEFLARGGLEGFR